MSSGEPQGVPEAATKKIVITGIAGRLGRVVARRLHRDPRYSLIGVDRRPFIGKPKDVEHLASTFFWKARNVETVILRPVHILGTVHNAPSNYLRLDPIPMLLGFDPMVQLIHEQDVAEAIAAGLAPGARGIYNIVGPGE